MKLEPGSTAKIGAFATDLLLRTRPQLDLDRDGSNDIPSGPPERLLVPVRGDTTLHWFDVEDGMLECGQAGNDGACDNAHRAGQNAAKENTRDLSLATEPFAIDASQDGRTIVVTNQTSGTASLFVDDWSQQGPFLRFALASESIPSRPVGIVSLPRTGSFTPETFLMTFRNSAQVRLLRFEDDEASTPEREYLIDNGGVGIDANSVGSDSRGIAVDPSARELALARCSDGDQACRDQAVLTPIDVYVANRSPSSLLIGRTQPPLEYPYFFQSLPLTTGPSRVVVGKVRAASGELEVRVFVVCFDSRRIFVYDPKRKRFEAEILTGRGPHAVAIDTQRALMYVAHFTDSFVGVFSLDLGSPASYGSMLGMLGTPKAPRSSK
jgi:DNA-binding beta-propeller fold protein YncE